MKTIQVSVINDMLARAEQVRLSWSAYPNMMQVYEFVASNGQTHWFDENKEVQDIVRSIVSLVPRPHELKD